MTECRGFSNAPITEYAVGMRIKHLAPADSGPWRVVALMGNGGCLAILGKDDYGQLNEDDMALGTLDLDSIWVGREYFLRTPDRSVRVRVVTDDLIGYMSLGGPANGVMSWAEPATFVREYTPVPIRTSVAVMACEKGPAGCYVVSVWRVPSIEDVKQFPGGEFFCEVVGAWRLSMTESLFEKLYSTVPGPGAKAMAPAALQEALCTETDLF